VFSTVYFCFRNYQNTGAVFVSENTVPLSFPIKKCESKSGGVFHRPFSSLPVTLVADPFLVSTMNCTLNLFVRFACFYLFQLIQSHRTLIYQAKPANFLPAFYHCQGYGRHHEHPKHYKCRYPATGVSTPTVPRLA